VEAYAFFREARVRAETGGEFGTRLFPHRNYFDETGWRDLSPKQVVSRTLDAGAAAVFAGQTLNWSVDLFHTVNSNDIQFIATTTSQGYFDNVGNTRRRRDLALGGKLARFDGMPYTVLSTPLISLISAQRRSNSTADENGDIQSLRQSIPLIPRHNGRLMLDYARRNSRASLSLPDRLFDTICRKANVCRAINSWTSRTSISTRFRSRWTTTRTWHPECQRIELACSR